MNQKLNSKRIYSGVLNAKGKLESIKAGKSVPQFFNKSYTKAFPGAVGTKAQILKKTGASINNITFYKHPNIRPGIKHFLNKRSIVPENASVSYGKNVIYVSEKVPGPFKTTVTEHHEFKAKTVKNSKKKV